MIQHLNQSNFQSTINDNSVVLVDFYAAWCGPCQALHPTLESLATDFDGKAVISKIDVDNNPELSLRFGIRSIPTLLYFQNGKLVDIQQGLQSKSIISQNISNLIRSDK